MNGHSNTNSNHIKLLLSKDDKKKKINLLDLVVLVLELPTEQNCWVARSNELKTRSSSHKNSVTTAI